MDPISFAKRTQEKNTIVLDIRSYEAFGGQHVPGAYHIDFGGNFSTFAGWVLPPDADVLIVSEGKDQADAAVVGLQRVGIDRTIGYLDGGMYEWAKAGFATDHVAQLCAEELSQRMVKGNRFSLVDVRAKREFQTGHIEGAINIPAPDLRSQYKNLDATIPWVVICNTGHRSSLGASILKQKGFEDVSNVAGGMTGYNASGRGTECPVCLAPHLPDAQQKK
jgi:rhodanese-related sulfurtransferase